MQYLKKVLGFTVLFALLACFAYAVLPGALDVQVAHVQRGALQATVEAQGKTRVRTRYLVSAPIAGYLARTTLHPGDDVQQGQPLATLAPAAPPLLDARSRAEAQARLLSARAAEEAAAAAELRAKLALGQAERELERARRLAASDAVAPQQVENAESSVRLYEQEARGAAYAVERSKAESELARAALHESGSTGQASARTVVRAPISGKVLRVQQEHEGLVQPGTALFEIGDVASLEIVVDLPTTQAVRVRPGAQVSLVRWGGSDPLQASVRAIEPSAFTKVTALGVEEQRVHVIIDPAADSAALLGDGYQVDARIVVWERPDALKVSTGALVRDGSGWGAFVTVGDKVERHSVQVGEMNAHEAEVRGGLSEGEQVVLYPGDRLNAGRKVRTRLETPRSEMAKR